MAPNHCLGGYSAKHHRSSCSALSLEVFKKSLGVVLWDMVQWGNIRGRQMVGLYDPAGLFQLW